MTPPTHATTMRASSRRRDAQPSYPVYLDCQATTPLDPRVRAAMEPYLDSLCGNPHSDHLHGWEAARAVDDAADAVASLIGAARGEIVFTSGASEANNLALQGVARSSVRGGNHVLVSAIEHSCVLKTARHLARYGMDVEIVPVGADGRLDAEQFIGRIRENTVLASLMAANNEIGTVQPVSEIGAACRERGVVFHTDAAQAAGKIPIDVAAMSIDLLSLSGHKMYGPQGIGALFVSRHCPVKLEPLVYGGAHQQGLRAGTVPTFLCAGLGEACRIAADQMEQERDHCLRLRTAFVETLREYVPEIAVNGSLDHRLPGNLNLRFPGVDADSLLVAVQSCVSASTGSACNSGIIESSYVLAAIGLSPDQIKSSIRFGFGRFTSLESIIAAGRILGAAARNTAHRLDEF